MKHAVYLPEASREAQAAADWYERRASGLGDQFEAALKEAEEFIRMHPAAAMPYRHATRKWRVPGFPYSLIYREETDRIVIFAVAHAKQHPAYWQRRRP